VRFASAKLLRNRRRTYRRVAFVFTETYDGVPVTDDFVSAWRDFAKNVSLCYYKMINLTVRRVSVTRANSKRLFRRLVRFRKCSRRFGERESGVSGQRERILKFHRRHWPRKTTGQGSASSYIKRRRAWPSFAVNYNDRCTTRSSSRITTPVAIVLRPTVFFVRTNVPEYEPCTGKRSSTLCRHSRASIGKSFTPVRRSRPFASFVAIYART